MNFLITGCAGFIGSHLSETLIKQGHKVVGIDNMNQFYDPDVKKKNLLAVEKLAERQKQEFYFYLTDIRHEKQVEQIMREHEIEFVIHLAAMAGVRPSLKEPSLYMDVNQMGTTNMLEEAKKLGIKKFIFASSSSVYGNNKKVPFAESDTVDTPVSFYAATKKSGELVTHIYHKLHEMTVANLRFFTVYGPRQRPDLAIHKFTKLMFAGEKIPVYGDGTKSRDFTYVDDIIDGILKTIDWVNDAKEPKYEIFNLGESETTTVKGLIELLEKAIGVKANIEWQEEVPGDVDTTYADISKAREVLGYDPKTKIQEGIPKFVEWFKKENNISL